ncbi:LacI family DNA-binding transcriptional regulator [Cellulomonas soli]
MSDKDVPQRAATIFDVARLAGVSHQTVSRVLNDLPNVRPTTRDRVEQAIKQLRYTPSPAARALVTKRTRVVGLIVTAGAGYGPSSIALHVNEAARQARYSVLTISMLSPVVADVRQAIESLIRQSVEGIVLVAAEQAVVSATYEMDIGVPMVTVDPTEQATGASVAIDQYAGARLATEHLIGLGHTAVAHLAGPEASPDGAERVRGWRDALAEAGLPARGLVHGDWSARSGFEYASRPEVGTACTAVFASNDSMALGIVHGLTVRGLRVPADVSVVGFDDIPEAAHVGPPLTTVRQDFEALGSLLMARLLAAIESDGAPRPTKVLPTLVVRESTAVPASRKP